MGTLVIGERWPVNVQLDVVPARDGGDGDVEPFAVEYRPSARRRVLEPFRGDAHETR